MDTKYSSIGWAVGMLLNGHQMRRRGWNNRIEFIAYVPKGAMQVPEKFGGGHLVEQVLVAKRKFGGLIPWTPTQNDLLQDDWEMVNPVRPGHYSDKAITADNPEGRVTA